VGAHRVCQGRTSRRSTAVTCVSALVRDVDRARAIEAGFDMYLPRPIAPERLVLQRTSVEST
jgi:DNA-binding response OmpR family regulator